jgi:hypothetical protein
MTKCSSADEGQQGWWSAAALMKCKQCRWTAAVQMKMKCSNADDEVQQGRRRAAAQTMVKGSDAEEGQ